MAGIILLIVILILIAAALIGGAVCFHLVIGRVPQEMNMRFPNSLKPTKTAIWQGWIS
jgi:Zn-dependent membrane protease YugP